MFLPQTPLGTPKPMAAQFCLLQGWAYVPLVQRKKDQAIDAARNHCSGDSPQEQRCSGTSNAPTEPLLMWFLAELGSKNLQEVGRRCKKEWEREAADKQVLSIQLHLPQLLAISRALFSILFSHEQGTF